MQKRAFSLLEVLISMVILAITMAGLASLFISGKRYILHSRARIAGGELSRMFLDPLQMNVRQDTWEQPGNCLSSNPTSGCPGAQALSGINYTPVYAINDVAAGSSDLRRVQVKIRWTEPSPN